MLECLGANHQVARRGVEARPGDRSRLEGERRIAGELPPQGGKRGLRQVDTNQPAPDVLPPQQRQHGARSAADVGNGRRAAQMRRRFCEQRFVVLRGIVLTSQDTVVRPDRPQARDCFRRPGMEMRVERQILSFEAARTEDVLVEIHQSFRCPTTTAVASLGPLSRTGVI